MDGWMLLATSEDPYVGFVDEEACATYSIHGGTLTVLRVEECESGGWATRATIEYPFAAFGSQSECVEYVVGGGTISALLPAPTGRIVFAYTQYAGFLLCQVGIDAEGFDGLPAGALVTIEGTLSNGVRVASVGMGGLGLVSSPDFSATADSSTLPTYVGAWSTTGGTVVAASGSYTYNGVTTQLDIAVPEAPCSTASAGF